MPNSDKMLFVHYGSNHFDPHKFDDVKNLSSWFYHKPHGGLWGTPSSGKTGWKEWCIEENYRVDQLSESFRFRIRKGSNVLVVHKKSDLAPFIIVEGGCYFNDLIGVKCDRIDFESVKQHYDAIVAIKSNFDEDLFGYKETPSKKTKGSYDWQPQILYGWDCDSILVLNRGCVVEEFKK
jgi:hypothetical protein